MYLSFPNCPKVHPGGGVSQRWDWLTDLQRDPSHAKDTIYNTCTAVVSVSCSPVKARFSRQQAGPTPAHAAAKRPQHVVLMEARKHVGWPDRLSRRRVEMSWINTGAGDAESHQHWACCEALTPTAVDEGSPISPKSAP